MICLYPSPYFPLKENEKENHKKLINPNIPTSLVELMKVLITWDKEVATKIYQFYV